jgi:hypothetical protein
VQTPAKGSLPDGRGSETTGFDENAIALSVDAQTGTEYSLEAVFSSPPGK